MIPLSSVAFYGGVAASAPLTSVMRMRELGLEPFYIGTVAFGKRLSKRSILFAWETEGQLTQHFGNRAGPLALNAALLGRFLETPWSGPLGGSFALGGGLSYAFGIPPLEERELERTSRTLMYLLFDFEVGLPDRWSALMRIHHRSGVFGLFNGVTGGSDYLCLGLKYRW